jgi:CxxC motif-containing protein (DUF1111 family)
MILRNRSGDLNGGFAEPEIRVVVLHRQSTDPDYRELRRRRLSRVSPRNPELVNRPKPKTMADLFRIGDKDFEPYSPLPFEERNTPALFGAGLIDLVPWETIQRIAREQPEDLRGRLPRVAGGGFGRFGWKSQNTSLLDFCENACAVELGLETPRRRQAEDVFRPRPNEQTGEQTGEQAGEKSGEKVAPRAPDMTEREVLALTAYVDSIPAPIQLVETLEASVDVEEGERLFTSIGCAACHRPAVGDLQGLYSDLLLHDVGTVGSVYYQAMPAAVDVVSGERIIPAGANEFRTPPLWGLADSGPYLHDGSAPTINLAIFKHGRQAAKSKTAYERLDPGPRSKLLAFLHSLRAPGKTDRIAGGI